jgi:hypothetical protein
MSEDETAAVVRAYHDAWTAGDFERAAALLAAGLRVEVPVNEYPTAESFAATLKGFGSRATRLELLAAMTDGEEGILLYDMDLRADLPARRTRGVGRGSGLGAFPG